MVNILIDCWVGGTIDARHFLSGAARALGAAKPSKPAQRGAWEADMAASHMALGWFLWMSVIIFDADYRLYRCLKKQLEANE